VGEFIRVLHIDPFPACCGGLPCVFAASADIRAVAEAQDIGAALAIVRALKPDVVVTEIDVPDEDSCFAAIESLHRQGSDTKVVVYTRFPDKRYTERARTAGAWGYVTKDASLDTLLRAIREVVAGHRFFADQKRVETVLEVAPDLVESAVRLSELLSPRELEVAKLLAMGLSVKQIAAALHRSPKTIETHTTHLMAKLSIHDRVALSRLAIREGLICA
jgi:DNA-binding NarL/FixJ family response regulator